MFFRLFLLTLVIFSSGCSNFDKLHEDLVEIDNTVVLFNVNIDAEQDKDAPVIVVGFEDDLGSKIISARLLPKPGNYEYNSLRKNQYVFAFQDINRDLTFQSSEPYAWHNRAKVVEITQQKSIDITLVLKVKNHPEVAPKNFHQIENIEQLVFAGMKFNLGTISSLDDPLLSSKHALKGLWEPVEFIKDGSVGIHFLKGYDAKKIPVLYVHGINGAPDNFKDLIQKLDQNKYQAWVFSYPSGFSLKMISTGLYSMLSTLEHKIAFKQLHLVAHSMGGLVSKGYINLCIKNESCDYLKSFTSISTPWGGHDAAALGVKYAPEIVPVWHDMSPNSEYLSTLFTPKSTIPHTLLFSFKSTSMLTTENTDDVVSVAAQLRYEAQTQAVTIYGYNEGHMSILANEALAEKVAAGLDKYSNK